MNRFLDNVNECELIYQTYATPHQRLAIKKLRRTGAGVTNIVGWMFKKNLAYATPEANEAFEEFMRLFNYWLYQSSEVNGKEKGNFGLFNKEKWKSSPFVNRVLEDSVELNKKYGVPILNGNSARNVTNSSIAPTGTLSLMFRDLILSYGIEAAFFMYFWKRTRMSGSYQYYFNVPKVVRDAFDAAGCPIPMKSDTIKDDWNGTQGKPIVEFIEKNLSKVGIKFKSSTEIDQLSLIGNRYISSLWLRMKRKSNL
jgi:ribonucleotide reductase alpha subunit